MLINTTMIFLVLGLAVAFLLLQIFLSKRENKYLGLIMPAITLGLSLVSSFGLIAYTPLGTKAIVEVLAVFVTQNIPTAVLLIIYKGCRKKYKKKSELDKMNIQDL